MSSLIGNCWRFAGVAMFTVAGATLGCSQEPAKVDVKELERQQEETMKLVREQERLERFEQQKQKAAQKAGANQ